MRGGVCEGGGEKEEVGESYEVGGCSVPWTREGRYLSYGPVPMPGIGPHSLPSLYPLTAPSLSSHTSPHCSPSLSPLSLPSLSPLTVSSQSPLTSSLHTSSPFIYPDLTHDFHLLFSSFISPQLFLIIIIILSFLFLPSPSSVFPYFLLLLL